MKTVYLMLEVTNRLYPSTPVQSTLNLVIYHSCYNLALVPSSPTSILSFTYNLYSGPQAALLPKLTNSPSTCEIDYNFFNADLTPFSFSPIVYFGLDTTTDPIKITVPKTDLVAMIGTHKIKMT